MGEYREYINRGLRSVNGIVNQIIAVRKYPGNYHLSFLIVEGETDRKLFETYSDITKCKVTVVDGKENAKEVMLLLEKDNFLGVLAIVDADFELLEGKSSPSQNLLFTDTHDLETMIIQSPALEKVLSQFGSDEKIAKFIKKCGKSIRQQLIECGMPIGYLLWVSLRENLSLDFNDLALSFDKFIDKETLILDDLKLIRLVQSRSYEAPTNRPQKPFLPDSIIQTKMKQLMSSDSHNAWHVCCGHDLTCILSLGLRSALGSHKTIPADPKTIEKWLQLAFERSHFQKTQLYSSIQKWEKTNRPFVILSVE